MSTFREIFFRWCAWKSILCVKFFVKRMRETQFFAWKFLQEIHAWNFNNFAWKKSRIPCVKAGKPCVKKLKIFGACGELLYLFNTDFKMSRLTFFTWEKTQKNPSVKIINLPWKFSNFRPWKKISNAWKKYLKVCVKPVFFREKFETNHAWKPFSCVKKVKKTPKNGFT